MPGDGAGGMSIDLFSAAAMASRWSAGNGGWTLRDEFWLVAVSGRLWLDVPDLADGWAWMRGLSLGVAKGDTAAAPTAAPNAAISIVCLLPAEETGRVESRSMRIWSICFEERIVWDPWSELTKLGCCLSD